MISGNLAEILDPTALGDKLFRADARPTLPGRVFGGQLLGQAVISAGRTVPPGQLPHSLHAYFERSGDWTMPIDYIVETQRDGRSSSRRRVVAVQGEDRLATVELSFHAATSVVSEPSRPRTDLEQASWTNSVAGAEMAVVLDAWLEKLSQMLRLEVRFFEEPARARILRTGSASSDQRFLVRSVDALPDDPLVQAAALAYLSDMFLLASSLGPRGVVMGDPRVRAVSLDHAMWFHTTPVTGQWLLHETTTAWSSSDRALCRGQLVGLSGQVLAHSVQEGLVRVAACD